MSEESGKSSGDSSKESSTGSGNSSEDGSNSSAEVTVPNSAESSEASTTSASIIEAAGINPEKKPPDNDNKTASTSTSRRPRM